MDEALSVELPEPALTGGKRTGLGQAGATDYVSAEQLRMRPKPQEKDEMEPEMEPFRVDVPDEVLNDLHARLRLTRWADDFANEGWQYGTNTAYLKELVAYWIDGYDWRNQERAINAYPQFRAQIDGVSIHFIHVRGKGPGSKPPKPLILSHGSPHDLRRQSVDKHLQSPQ